MNILSKIINNSKRPIPEKIPSPADLMVPEGESSIEWILDPARYPFVRVKVVNTKTRYRLPRLSNDRRLIGFSVVGDRAPFKDGRYTRRAFYLFLDEIRAFRLLGDGDSSISIPVDAVRPLTIQPGRWGVRS